MENKNGYVSDDEIKKIPSSLEECYRPTPLVLRLRAVTKIIMKTARILMKVVVIIGLINAITSSLIYDYGSSVEDFDIGNFVMQLISTALEVLYIGVAVDIVGVILSSLLNFIYNNSITTNVALYEAYQRKKETSSSDK